MRGQGIQINLFTSISFFSDRRSETTASLIALSYSEEDVQPSKSKNQDENLVKTDENAVCHPSDCKELYPRLGQHALLTSS
jgi:hypothetical protein